MPQMRLRWFADCSVNGINYVHFQALSDEEDLQGFLAESVEGGKSQR